MPSDKTAGRLIPDMPERQGYHWVRRYKLAPAIPLFWYPDWHANAGNGWGGIFPTGSRARMEISGCVHLS